MTSPKERLIEALKNGTCVQFNSDESHEIAGDWLADLLAGRVPLWKPHAKGLMVKGARITGPIQWSEDCFESRFSLQDCTFDESIQAAGLRIKHGGASFAGSTVPGLDISDGRIDGELDLTGLNVCGKHDPEKPALDLNGIAVSGSLMLKGATVCGKTDATGADVGGDFDCTGATLTNPDDVALGAGAIKVAYSVVLTNIVASGGVNLRAATINTQLIAENAHLIHPSGEALSLDRAQIKGHTILTQGFVAAGEVSLSRTHIEGRLDLKGGSLKGAKAALTGDGMRVAGRLCRRFSNFPRDDQRSSPVNGPVSCVS
jgi:hypothetical protein